MRRPLPAMLMFMGLPLLAGCGSWGGGAWRSVPPPTVAQADAVWRHFALDCDASRFVRAETPKLLDAWKVASCVIRQPGFWDRADTLTADRSAIVRRRGKLTIRQLAAQRYVRWRRALARPRLVVLPVGLAKREPFEKFSATTAVNGDTVRLRRWQLHASIEELAATLVHEWLHTLGFRDPVKEGDRSSLVYGTQAIARELAGTDGCQVGLSASYISP